MGLKTREVTIATTEGNRDSGKKFLLTEMPALKAEKWARHAAAAVNRSDLDIREEIKQLGMLGFYLAGFQALAGGDIDQVDALMDQMLPLIHIVEPKVTRPLTPDGGDIEEVTTIIQLRKDLLELHMGFTLAELVQILKSSATPLQEDSQNTSMSETSSEPLSPSTAE
jgi:hypothetical protein